MQNERSVDFPRLRDKYRGTKVRELIEHHLHRQTQQERINGIAGTLSTRIPAETMEAVDGFVEKWRKQWEDGMFWERDTAAVFDEITEDARNCLAPFNLEDDDEIVFDLFNLVVLAYASDAYQRPDLRRIAGIGLSESPTFSAMGLLFVVLVSIYEVSTIRATPLEHLGGGLSNLGYVLFAAGAFSGTFLVFGLRRRLRVFAVGVLVFVVGTVLINLAPS